MSVFDFPTAIPVDSYFGASGIRVRALTFALDGDLEANGRRFVEELVGAA